MTPILL